MNTSNITNYKPKDFAELLGVSVKTLQRWDRENILKANRTPTDRRYYTYEQYLQFKGINTEKDNRDIVIYARVSTKNQKDDLRKQVDFLKHFANAKGMIVDHCIEDFGSGLNYNRKKWNELLEKVMEQKVKWIRLKEKGYVPVHADVKSGTVSVQAGRYYVSVLVREEDLDKTSQNNQEPIGIDLGIKDFAICSNGKTYKNINKSKEVKRLEKKLKREQKCLSRKYENKKKMKGEAACKNIQKQVLKVQRIYQKLANIRTNYINKCVNEIVKAKPSYITIEDLNVKGMMKNRHLSKAAASQKFYEFRIKLEAKCRENGIELRVADRWYPSSKLCHECGNVKRDLKLSDRIYKCECGYEADRDFNASLNLRDAVTYRIAE